MQHNLREFLRHGGSGQYVFARQNGAVYGCRAGIAAVQRSAERLGLDLTTVEGVLAARAHAWGQFNSGRFSGADRSGPSSEIVAEALALHELSYPGALGRALSGNQEDIATIQSVVEKALEAWQTGRLSVQLGDFSSGWIEVFPELTEGERRLGELPGFTPNASSNGWKPTRPKPLACRTTPDRPPSRILPVTSSPRRSQSLPVPAFSKRAQPTSQRQLATSSGVTARKATGPSISQAKGTLPNRSMGSSRTLTLI